MNAERLTSEPSIMFGGRVGVKKMEQQKWAVYRGFSRSDGGTDPGCRCGKCKVQFWLKWPVPVGRSLEVLPRIA